MIVSVDESVVRLAYWHVPKIVQIGATPLGLLCMSFADQQTCSLIYSLIHLFIHTHMLISDSGLATLSFEVLLSLS